MIREEWKALLKNKLLFLVVIVIGLIPAIYAGLFLASMWDPYGETENLPVAVVNKDQEVLYNDKIMNIGKSMAESLEENDSMAFNIVDEQVAKTGLENGTYYMVITIPENFSQNATTLMDENPQKMELNYQTNPGKNYIAMKMTESALKEIRRNVSAEVTSTYAEALLSSLGDVGDGFTDAADGASKLVKGENKIKKGNTKIKNNLDLLASSTITFKNGSNTFSEGLKTYLEGVNTAKLGANELVSNNKKLNKGVSSVANGVKKISAGSSSILKGLNTMKSEISKSLSKDNVKSINFAATSLNTMNDSIQTLNKAVNGDGKNNKGLSLDGLTTSLGSVGANAQTAGTEITTAAGKLVGNYAATGNVGGAGGKITEAYKTLAVLYAQTEDATAKATIKAAMDKLYNPANMADTNTALGGIISSTSNLSAAGTELKTAGATLNAIANSDMSTQIGQLKKGVKDLSDASNQLLPASSNALTSLLQGLQKVEKGLTQTKAKDGETGLIEGMNTLDKGVKKLKKGISKKGGLQSGVKDYTQGVAKLESGLTTLTENNDKLKNGAADLTSGASQIADGAGKLSAGSSKVGNGLNELIDGTKTLKTSLKEGADTIKENSTGDSTVEMFAEPVETKGETITTVKDNGHAMAAYMMSVGLWIGSLAFCLMYPLTRYRGKLKNGFAWWASKAAVIYPLSLIMPAALILALNLFLGFSPENMGLTILAATITSLSFVSIMYFFNMLLGKVGSFIMLIFTVMQLAGSAGTYPVEISGPMVPKIHSLVPFTYTVDAFRSTISGGQSIATDMIVLIVIGIIFTLLTILVFQIRSKRLKAGKPITYQWIEEKGLA